MNTKSRKIPRIVTAEEFYNELKKKEGGKKRFYVLPERYPLCEDGGMVAYLECGIISTIGDEYIIMEFPAYSTIKQQQNWLKLINAVYKKSKLYDYKTKKYFTKDKLYRAYRKAMIKDKHSRALMRRKQNGL